MARAGTRPSSGTTDGDARAAHTKETTMNTDLEDWTQNACTPARVDYRQEMFRAVRSQTPAGAVELYVPELRKATAAFEGMRGI